MRKFLAELSLAAIIFSAPRPEPAAKEPTRQFVVPGADTFAATGAPILCEWNSHHSTVLSV